MIKRLKAWLKERRIKRFRRQFADAYPDAEKFTRSIIWLDDKKDYIIPATLHVDDVVIYHQLTPEDEQAIKDWYNQN